MATTIEIGRSSLMDQVEYTLCFKSKTLASLFILFNLAASCLAIFVIVFMSMIPALLSDDNKHIVNYMTICTVLLVAASIYFYIYKRAWVGICHNYRDKMHLLINFQVASMIVCVIIDIFAAIEKPVTIPFSVAQFAISFLALQAYRRTLGIIDIEEHIAKLNKQLNSALI